MPAIKSAQPPCHKKIEDDSSPQAFRHSKRGWFQHRQTLQAEQRIRSQHERPDFLQVRKRKAKRLNHGGYINLSFNPPDLRKIPRLRGKPAGPLPEGGLGLDIREQRSRNQSKNRIEIWFSRLRQNTCSDVNLIHTESGNCRLACRPDNSIGLSRIDKALGGAGQSLCHAERESQINRQRKPRPRSE